MTKKDLIDEIKFELGLPTADATKAVDVAIRLVTEALSNGDAVKISGFGTFHVREKAARNYRNNATGELVKAKAGKRVQFKPSSRLTKMIQPGIDGDDIDVDTVSAFTMGAVIDQIAPDCASWLDRDHFSLPLYFLLFVIHL